MARRQKSAHPKLPDDPAWRGILGGLRPQSAQGLLVALYPHLHGRRSHLAELVLAEAQRIGRLEQHPTRTFVNDVEVTDEITDEMIQDGLDTLEGLDLSRGRSPRESAYRHYADAMRVVEIAVRHHWKEFSTVRNPRPHWQRLLRDLWDMLRAWPLPVRPQRSPQGALIDAIMTAKDPRSAARAIVAAAANRPDNDTFRRKLDDALSALKSRHKVRR